MTTTEALVTAPTGTWELDPVHSTVGFEVPYLAGVFKGQFRDVEARLVVGESQAELEGVAKVESVDVKDENLSAHLQSPDFFDAERHPELRFAATEIDLDARSVRARGEITIKGVTNDVDVSGTITLPITDPYGKERIGLQLSAAVDRTAFGVSWNVPLPSGEPALANEVTIVADLHFVKHS
jgi:polyisoprenoid-binding protein YceI